MRWSLTIALVLALALGTLTALAYATPPDQSWLGGLYDDGDYDDVVSLATASMSVETAPVQPRFELLRIVVAIVELPGAPSLASPGIVLRVPRAPPDA
jgi:hypothetical protein